MHLGYYAYQESRSNFVIANFKTAFAPALIGSIAA